MFCTRGRGVGLVVMGVRDCGWVDDFLIGPSCSNLFTSYYSEIT